MADDDGHGDWRDLLVPEAFSKSASTVEVGNWVHEGIWNNGVVDGMDGNDVVEGVNGNDVVEGMNGNDVVEGIGEEGAELMVGAAGSNNQHSSSGLREQGHVSNGNYSGLFGFDAGEWESSLAVHVGNTAGMAGQEVGNWTPEGIWNNGVGDGMAEKGVELMVGAAAGSSSQRSPSEWREQGPVSNGNYGGSFEFDARESSMAVHVGNKAGMDGQGLVSSDNYSGLEFGVGESSMAVQVPQSTVKVRNKSGAKRKAGRAPPGSPRQRSQSGSKEMAGAGGGSNEDYSKFALHIRKSVVRADAPQGMVVNLGEKRGADQMGAAPPGAAGSKRQRLLWGSGTSGGSNDEAMVSEFSHEAAALVNACRRRWPWDSERKSAWWDRPGYTDADFKRDFHMSRFTFFKLCQILDPAVAKQDTAARGAIPVPDRVAVCVYRFATRETFRGLQGRFGISPSTCLKIVLDVTAAINAIFQAGSVSALWPDGAGAMDAAAAKFQDLTGGIPGVIGAVYTTHVPVNEPKQDVVYYYNDRLTKLHKGKKASYSVSLQAAVDANGAFTDFCLGYPGATSDEQVFLLSSMSTTHKGEMVAQGKRIVGGTGYPLTDWTLVPYTDSNLTPPQETFNKKLALARGVALDAFRRLKARWAYLQMRAEGKLDVFSSVMAACCVLHNLCESSGDHLGDELKGYKLEDDEIVVDEPVRSAAAAQVRDAIAQYLYLQHAGAGGSMPS